MNGHHKLIVGAVSAGCLMLGAAGLIVGAGIANAEGSMGDRNTAAYVAEMEAVNMSGTLADANDLAAIVCEKRAAGASEAQMIRVAEARFSTQQATTVVLRGEFHFCPQYATSYRIGGAG
jgi:hypothetical protein